MPNLRSSVHLVAMVVTLTGLGLPARPALADITSTAGAITQIAHPTGTLNSNTLESDTTMYVWFEQRVDDPGALSVQHAGTGTVNSAGSANPTTIRPAFTDSYVIHFDQAGGGNATLSGAVTFERSIAGIWYTTAGLGGSDATFTPTGLTYGTLNFRGFELGTSSNRDRFSISADGRTLTILQSRTGGDGVDQLRVLVNPEPGTGALASIGVLALGALVARRRAARRRAADPSS